eukprot:531743_1
MKALYKYLFVNASSDAFKAECKTATGLLATAKPLLTAAKAALKTLTDAGTTDTAAATSAQTAAQTKVDAQVAIQKLKCHCEGTQCATATFATSAALFASAIVLILIWGRGNKPAESKKPEDIELEIRVEK